MFVISCPTDNTVTVNGNGDGTHNSFSFKIFQFSGNSGDVYLHCQIHLCAAQTETCVPVRSGQSDHSRGVKLNNQLCGPLLSWCSSFALLHLQDCSPADSQKRRSASSSYVVGAPALIALSWTKEVKHSEFNSQDDRSEKMIWSAFDLLVFSSLHHRDKDPLKGFWTTKGFVTFPWSCCGIWLWEPLQAERCLWGQLHHHLFLKNKSWWLIIFIIDI